MKILTRFLTTLGVPTGRHTSPVTAQIQASPSNAVPIPIPIATADEPIGFGYKTNWLAIRTDSPDAVISALNLSNVQPASWKSGVAISYAWQPDMQMKAVFVTPPICGWVLVTGKLLPYPESLESGGKAEIRRRFDAMFTGLAGKFPEVQFFGTYRVVGFDAWGRARDGKVERLFSFMDGVNVNIGAQTPEERSLGFLDLEQRTGEEATSFMFECAEQEEERITRAINEGMARRQAIQEVRQQGRSALPSESDTADLAGAWSIDPNKIDEMELPKSMGKIGYLPDEFSY